jgi:xanthine dehydrogenase/oxidase
VIHNLVLIMSVPHHPNPRLHAAALATCRSQPRVHKIEYPPVITTPQDDDEWTVLSRRADSQIKDTVTQVVSDIKHRLLSEISDTGVRVIVNGQLHVVEDVSPRMKLVEFLRYKCGLTSTKIGCGEGGCGACTVVLSHFDGMDKSKVVHMTVNSCLRPLFLCDGMAITTSEGFGGYNTPMGPNAVQTFLAEGNGSQCGYCSPGMCVQMCGLLLKNDKPSHEDVEKNFDGNLCRCTGYRPILQSFKDLVDVEDLAKKPSRPDFDKKIIALLSKIPAGPMYVYDKGFQSHWMRVERLSDLLPILDLAAKYPELSIKILSGSTGEGVSKYYDAPDFESEFNSIFVDISRVVELQTILKDNKGISLGACVSIASLLELFRPMEKWTRITDHLERIANHQVRNAGTWAGNLMLAKKHPFFGSDLQTILSGLSAKLDVYHQGAKKSLLIEEFADPSFVVDSSTLLISVFIPLPRDGEIVESYKVASRHVNAHAYANAAFSLVISAGKELLQIKDAKVVFGGITPGLLVPKDLVDFLKGRSMDQDTLTAALQMIEKICVPSAAPPSEGRSWVEVDPVYRTNLCKSYFYKFFLSILNKYAGVPARIESAAELYERPVSSGVEVFASDKTLDPVSYPVPKLKAVSQTTGEAKYSDDMENPANGLYGALVLSTIAKGKILSIDSSAALSFPGVVDFVSAQHVQSVGGINELFLDNGRHEVFASQEVNWIGQPIGIVVATSYKIAQEACSLVHIEYEVESALVSIEDAVAQGKYVPTTSPGKGMQTVTRGDVDAGFKQSKYIVKASTTASSQQHFYMETQVTVAKPTEDGGLLVHCSTQYPTGTRVRF